MGLPGAHKVATVAQIAAPQGTGRPQSDPRRTYLRWASQEPTKVATVAQIAAPQGTGRPQSGPRKTYLRWASQKPTKVATLAQIAAPQGTANTGEKEEHRRQGGWRPQCSIQNEYPTQGGLGNIRCFERSPPKPSACVPDGAGAYWNGALCHGLRCHTLEGNVM